MRITILQLLKDLFSYTSVNFDTTIYSGSKIILTQLRQEFDRLERSNEPEKQRKMINLFLGGTIFAMLQDEERYGYNLGALEIARKTWEHVTPSKKQTKEATVYNSYAIGDYIVKNLPVSLSRNLYLQNRTINKNPEIIPLFDSPRPCGPYFPEIVENIDKIDILLKFCAQYINSEMGLEIHEIDTDNLNIELNLESHGQINQTHLNKTSTTYKPILFTNSNKTIIEKSSIEESPTNSFEEEYSNLTNNASNEESESSYPGSYLNISMQILGLFMGVLGVASVAIGFTVLAASTGGIAAVILGVTAVFVGIGFFAKGTYDSCLANAEEEAIYGYSD